MRKIKLNFPITIQSRADELVEQHGGVSAAARAIGIDNAYFSRLRNGFKTEPSVRVLRKMGLERVVTYRRKE